jgi:hypothetical protein
MLILQQQVLACMSLPRCCWVLRAGFLLLLLLLLLHSDTVLVMMVPYDQLDGGAPFAAAFSTVGMHW